MSGISRVPCRNVFFTQELEATPAFVCFPHHGAGSLHLNRPVGHCVPSPSPTPLLLCSWSGGRSSPLLCFLYSHSESIWEGPHSAFPVAAFPSVWAVRWSLQWTREGVGGPTQVPTRRLMTREACLDAIRRVHLLLLLMQQFLFGCHLAFLVGVFHD